MKLVKIIFMGTMLFLQGLPRSCSTAENADIGKKTELEICIEWYNFDSREIPPEIKIYF